LKLQGQQAFATAEVASVVEDEESIKEVMVE